MAARGLYLGTTEGREARTELDPDHLTTHAVCVGMTGSGKTGLGVVALEELARRRVPLLVVDLKGDMANLLLAFPDLDGPSFAPWVPPDALDGRPRAEVGAEQAELWRRGLEGSGLGPEDVRAFRDGVAWQVVTPGLASGRPLDILPALAAPDGWREDPDGAAARVNGVTSGLLSLVGRGGDPLSDRDHVLVASVLMEHWRRGDALDLPGLLASLGDPPFDTLGVLPLDTFYPRRERIELVMALNTLLASPAFGAWTTGVPLAMEELLGRPGSPAATVVILAHLSEQQRHFVLTLLAAELVAWMRRQPASSGLRALLYVDELQGILPPHPANPPCKGPLLTLLKQGRAFGVGTWLATQNPVDIDYKALGNAGVKLVGRLVTDRDRERALEGLGLAGGAASEVERRVAALAKRQFLLSDVSSSGPAVVFSSRWAMSYLRGPVTIAELGGLLGGGGPVPSAADGEAGAERSTPPVLATAIETVFAAGGTGRAAAAVLIRSRARLARASLGIDRLLEEWWRVPAVDGGLDWEAAERLDGEPDVAPGPPPGMVFPAAAPAGLDRELGRQRTTFTAWRSRRGERVAVNRQLKLAASPGESQESFVARCLEAADLADDALEARIRDRFERRKEALARRLERERDELDRDRAQLSSRKAEQAMSVVEGLFSVLLGSRGARSAARKAASRARSTVSKDRMRRTAAASVEESEREIERLERELEELAEELQEEVDRLADEAERVARAVEEVELTPTRTSIEVVSTALLWS